MRRMRPTKDVLREKATPGGTTARDRVLNVDEPEHSEKRPTPPSELSARGRGYFETLVKRLEDMEYASDSYTELLTLAAETHDFIRRCRETVKFEKAGGIKRSTLSTVRVMQRAEFQLASYLGQLGLTPTMKPKVSAPNAKRKVIQQAKNPFSDLIGKRNGAAH